MRDATRVEPARAGGLEAERDAATPPAARGTAASAARPAVSVIVPLESHRGYAMRCIRAWATEQTFPRERFEIVVAAPPGYPAEELDEIRALLAPLDRVLELDAGHDMDLCVHAAAEASGELLLFTESHCLPEPETLARARATASRRPEWAGFSSRSEPITGNLLSTIEAETYGRDIAYGVIDHPWRKVLDQCFVVRRDAYARAGGFEPAFGHFAEWLIAARFHALGLTIGYAPDVCIHHLYVGDLGEWSRFTANFVEGQMAYLALDPGDPLHPMFDEIPEWSGRHKLRPRVARRICRILLRDLAQVPATRPAELLSATRHWHWRLLAGWGWRASAGPTAAVAVAEARRHATRLALRLDLLRRDRDRAAVRFELCCDAIVKAERTAFVRRWIRDRDEVEDGTSAPRRTIAGTWAPGRPAERHGVGFHLASGEGDERIRWSEPAAYVELPLAPGRHAVTVRWLMRPPTRGPWCLAFYLDERRLRSDRVRVLEDRAELVVDVAASAAPPRLGWVCAAHRAEGDGRALGLPVTSVSWRRVAA